MWSMRYINRLVALLVATVLLICVLMLGGALSAIEPEPGLRLQPAIIDIAGNPQATTTTSVTLTNTTDQPLAVIVDTRSLSPEDEPIDPSAVDRYDASRWVSFEDGQILLAPQTSRVVPINVDIPKEAVPGGHYALVVFRIVNDKPPDGTGVKINSEAGTVMLINVPGETIEEADIVLNDATGIAYGGQAELSYSVLNTGNTHILPLIRTDITDGNGRVIETVTQNTQLLLPNTKRTFSVTWGTEAAIGKYYATTSVSYGTPTQTVTVEATEITVLPSEGTIIAWILVAFLILVTFRRRLSAVVVRLVNKSPRSENKKA
jgi:hypothetical protein